MQKLGQEGLYFAPAKDSAKYSFGCNTSTVISNVFSSAYIGRPKYVVIVWFLSQTFGKDNL